MELSGIEFFGYITKTSQSWAGSIDEATYRINTKGFDKYILNRPALEGVSDKKRAKYLKHMLVWRPVVCRLMKPSVWKKTEEGLWEIKFTDYKAKENLECIYFTPSIPQTLQDVSRSIQGLNQNQRKDLADVMREFNGTKTNNKEIQDFLKNQYWYGQSPLKQIPAETIKAAVK